MSTSITRPHATEFITPDLQPGLRPVPSLDQLYQLTSRPDDRVVIHGVNWDFYDRLSNSIPHGSNLQIDYDGRDLEVMSPGIDHDWDKTLLGRLIETIAEELEIPCAGAGQTTWKRSELERGIEADECYFFRPQKLEVIAKARAVRSDLIADYPNPDLAVEVDISHPKIDRAGIYAALEVSEVWRLDGETSDVIIERLDEHRNFRVVEQSVYLPISSAEIRRWVIEEDSSDQSAWARRLREWIRKELASRLPNLL
jgi:Uma2 family endonuclease